MRGRPQSGQVIVLVAFALLALIGSAALVLIAGSVEWQKSQLQQIADEAALDSAMKIGFGCNAAGASTVITAADNFVASQRARTGALGIAAGTCATPYTGTDTFAGGLSETVHYPYRAHQQQVEVILTLTLPISFGTELGQTSTTVVRRAVGQQLAGSTTAISAGTLNCTGGKVNVAGSVWTGAISLTGGCALYAHERLDPSGAYSDLGNVSVYTGSQSWSGVGGSCTGAIANAICSDGFELSGHVAPYSCGTNGTTSFLSAGDAAVNPNPCAGLAPQPVAPVSALQPPEPNTDTAAYGTLQNSSGGLLGAPCTPAGSYTTPLKIGASTVATGLGPAPKKDAGGFYHFEPSCYSYLDLAPLASGGIAKLKQGPEVGPAKKDLILTVPGGSTAGTLLVAVLRSESSPSQKAFEPPNASWQQAGEVIQLGGSHTAIWYLQDNPGSLNNLDFGVDPASIDAVGQLTEWSGVATASALDQAGTLAVGTNQATVNLSTTGATTTANELVITDVGPFAQPQTITQGAGWNSLTNDGGNGFSSEYRIDLPAAVASETVKSSVATLWSGVIATFKPAGVVTGGAVLDPGFYYFNGSGLGSGGGICLNGATLLAKDVTLEFVNSTGFSSGTCAVGGGANCTGTCQFGSVPCSLSACPPNAGSDSPNNLTWFAAPCSTAPNLDSASCLGASSWCLAGDRACSNTLIWEAGTAGQIAITGSSVNQWLLGSIFWPGTCIDAVNGTSTIEGTVQCGTLSISAGGGAGTAIGGDYGISTALEEAVLVE